jgi:hypothetical protein
MKLSEKFCVDDSFAEYVQNVYLNEPKGEQRQELKMAFFAGAMQLRMWCDEIAMLHPKMCGSVLNRIDEELTDFMQATMQVEPTAPSPASETKTP